MTTHARSRLALGLSLVVACSSLAFFIRQDAPAAPTMMTAATKFLAGLSPEQRKSAAFGFDDPHREKWYFTPQQANKQSTRKGLRLDGLNDAQKAAAYELLKSGLSATGFAQAKTIVSLETLLAEFENNGGNVRNPQWYFVSIFGEPSATGAWGWRFEGHHLSVNVTLDKGEVVSATPLLFATNPAEVRTGAKKGLRPLADIEDTAKDLIATLTDEQNATAKQTKLFGDIQEGRPDANVGAPVGIPAAKLAAAQKDQLRKLIATYAGRFAPVIAKEELKRIDDAGADKLFFAYGHDAAKPGKPTTYRIQGPTFVVEFLNVQADALGNPANHIHSGWRRLPKDF